MRLPNREIETRYFVEYGGNGALERTSYMKDKMSALRKYKDIKACYAYASLREEVRDITRNVIIPGDA